MSVPRLMLVGLVTVVVASSMVMRLIDLQTSPDPRLLRVPGGGPQAVDLAPPRGDVVDRFGRELAISLPSSTVIADPRLIGDAHDAATQLAPLLGAPVDEIAATLSEDRSFVYLARQIDPDIGGAVGQLGLAGVGVLEEPRRVHPNGDCSALAAVGRVNVDHVGMSGLEEVYDDVLSGEPGLLLRETGTDGMTIPGAQRVVQSTRDGDDVAVTLDRNIQFRAEQLLVDAVSSMDAMTGVALVAIPETGEIVAMANARRDGDGLVGCTRENLAATWAFEPGSIVKPITMAGVVGSGVWGELMPVEVPASITRYDHTFRDDPWHGDELWTPTDILARSSNVGTIKLAEALGADRLHDLLAAFGLGQRTGLGFKGESSGILLDVDEWNGLTLSNNAIGQGIAATPLQMLQVYNVIANDGIAVNPVLVTGQSPVAGGRRIIDDTTAAAVRRMMGAVVRTGTGAAAAIDGYVVQGKTGTAWQPCDDGYTCADGGRHHTASFGAIIGNDHGPALTVLVVIDQPLVETSGGKVAAPVAADLARYALHQLRIPPAADAVTPEDRVRVEAASAPAVEVPEHS